MCLCQQAGPEVILEPRRSARRDVDCSEAGQRLAVFPACALELLGVDPEYIEDGRGDLSRFHIIVVDRPSNRRVRNEQGNVAVVLGEAAMLGQLRAMGVDQAVYRNSDEVRSSVVAEG